MTLDELSQVRTCLYEAHNQITGKIKVNRGLLLTTIKESMQMLAERILEEKHKKRSPGRARKGNGNTPRVALDAESGVYKSHALSAELLKLAALKFKIVPFTRACRRWGYGR